MLIRDIHIKRRIRDFVTCFHMLCCFTAIKKSSHGTYINICERIPRVWKRKPKETARNLLEREMLVDRLELYGLFILGELSKSCKAKEDTMLFFHCTTPRVDENIAQLSV